MDDETKALLEKLEKTAERLGYRRGRDSGLQEAYELIIAQAAHIEELVREIGELRAGFRINMLRFGATDIDIDAALSRVKQEGK